MLKFFTSVLSILILNSLDLIAANKEFNSLNYFLAQVPRKDVDKLFVEPVVPIPAVSTEAPFEELPNELPNEFKDIYQENTEPPQPPGPESFPVIFKAFYRATLSSEVTSRILKITKRMGEHFKEGELLIHLDDRIYEGFKEKALGNLGKAESELASKQELFKEKIASFMEVKSAQAEVAVAHSDLISAEHAINACYIRGPFDGKVVNLFVEEFELIQEGKPLIEILNDDSLIGQVLVPARLLSQLIIDRPVKVQIQETNSIVDGKILRIEPVIDPASSLIKIDIVVDNRAQKLRSGMIGQVIFEVEKIK